MATNIPDLSNSKEMTLNILWAALAFITSSLHAFQLVIQAQPTLAMSPHICNVVSRSNSVSWSALLGACGMRKTTSISETSLSASQESSSAGLYSGTLAKQRRTASLSAHRVSTSLHECCSMPYKH